MPPPYTLPGPTWPYESAADFWRGQVERPPRRFDPARGAARPVRVPTPASDPAALLARPPRRFDPTRGAALSPDPVPIATPPGPRYTLPGPTYQQATGPRALPPGRPTAALPAPGPQRPAIPLPGPTPPGPGFTPSSAQGGRSTGGYAPYHPPRVPSPQGGRSTGSDYTPYRTPAPQAPAGAPPTTPAAAALPRTPRPVTTPAAAAARLPRRAPAGAPPATPASASAPPRQPPPYMPPHAQTPSAAAPAPAAPRSWAQRMRSWAGAVVPSPRGGATRPAPAAPPPPTAPVVPPSATPPPTAGATPPPTGGTPPPDPTATTTTTTAAHAPPAAAPPAAAEGAAAAATPRPGLGARADRFMGRAMPAINAAAVGALAYPDETGEALMGLMTHPGATLRGMGQGALQQVSDAFKATTGMGPGRRPQTAKEWYDLTTPLHGIVTIPARAAWNFGQYVLGPAWADPAGFRQMLQLGGARLHSAATRGRDLTPEEGLALKRSWEPGAAPAAPAAPTVPAPVLAAGEPASIAGTQSPPPDPNRSRADELAEIRWAEEHPGQLMPRDATAPPAAAVARAAGAPGAGRAQLLRQTSESPAEAPAAGAAPAPAPASQERDSPTLRWLDGRGPDPLASRPPQPTLDPMTEGRWRLGWMAAHGSPDQAVAAFQALQEGDLARQRAASEAQLAAAQGEHYRAQAVQAARDPLASLRAVANDPRLLAPFVLTQGGKAEDIPAVQRAMNPAAGAGADPYQAIRSDPNLSVLGRYFDKSHPGYNEKQSHEEAIDELMRIPGATVPGSPMHETIRQLLPQRYGQAALESYYTPASWFQDVTGWYGAGHPQHLQRRAFLQQFGIIPPGG